MDEAFDVTLAPDGQVFQARPGLTLLASAERAGIAWPSSCRAGTCRSCMVRCLRGEVAYTVEWPGLIPEEKAQGFILPCVALARGPLLLERPASPAG
ncbi:MULTISPECIES: 2Fe-2S iron-sulfur cluster-binding protein [Ramlibacter]|uniref:2Fe-2S iron-sulfur cluster binding domain-containing protein n=1 Tax=Ramlibacter aquaticus TaxID=2780094 RepID=A0ABR9S9W3_9BURK|nr:MULTISPECIES: 2Fe-2S iron-sulfur cluster-binding protein [Ramlibacter]MBE7939014.1 2Fe-2S iron-sulfur cluster binding domain-containing protein [Ramlibacter aquaticus]